MNRFLRPAAIGLALALLAACQYTQPRMLTDVTTFHDFPESWVGSTIAVIPYEKQDSRGLEWKKYSGMLEQRLKAQGYSIADLDQARYAAFFGYAIDKGREVVSTYSVPKYGVTGYTGYSAYGSTTITPQYGITGSQTKVRTDTVYSRAVKIEIYDTRRKEVVWEMTLESQGSCRRLTNLMRYFLEAAFKDFPGPDGDGRQIVIPLENYGCPPA